MTNELKDNELIKKYDELQNSIQVIQREIVKSIPWETLAENGKHVLAVLAYRELHPRIGLTDSDAAVRGYIRRWKEKQGIYGG